jgi:broad specificity phosphatase PhoE
MYVRRRPAPDPSARAVERHRGIRSRIAGRGIVFDAVLIYLVRHGESYVNLTRTFSYRHVDEGLTPRGRQQAERLASWLQTRPNLAHIYSSPLKRGLETARAIGQAIGVDVVPTEALREINVGALEGHSDQPAWDLHDGILRRWHRGELDASFPEGENFRQLRARIMTFLEDLPEDGDVVAIGHGGIFCNVLPELCEVPWNDDTRPFTLDNTGVSIFRREDAFTCEQWNGRDHLL